MNNDEWRAICLHMENGWKGDMTDERRAAYHTFVGEFEAPTVLGALRLLAEAGSPWLPTVPELVKACRGVTQVPVPPWTEVWQEIQRAMDASASGRPWAADHPIVAAFVQNENPARLRYVEFYSPEYGDLKLRDLERRWDEFVDVYEARDRQALARGDRVAVEAGFRPALERGDG